MISENNLVSIKKAASMLGVTTLTLRNWDKRGKLVPLRHPINNYRVYKLDDISKLISDISSNTRPVLSMKIKPTKTVKKLLIKHL